MALVSLITVIALLKASNLSPAHEEASHNLAQEMGLVERIHVMIVMCHKHNDGSTKEEEQRSRLLLQAETLVKTLVLFSSRPITLHIAHNNITIVNHMQEAVAKFDKGAWLRLASVPIEYPAGLEDMINGWKICATARLFLQDLLPEVDAGIFLDTDTVLLDDPALLWDRFQLFSPFTALALAPVEAHYSVVKAKPLPYYGPPGSGLNGGVALMNLTRLRALPGGGFTEAVRYIWERHKGNLPLADQDILNVVGGQSPYLLQPLPCEWNYHTWQCRPDRTERGRVARMRSGGNLCPAAHQHGIALLHGNCQAFAGADAVLTAVFKFWAEQEVQHWQPEQGLAELEGRIDEAVSRDRSKDSCARVPGLADMILFRLRRMVNQSSL